MNRRRILITENDLKRSQALVEATRSSESEDRRSADTLAKQLTRAKAVRSAQMPENVVTMNSCIQLLHLDSSEKTEHWLRFRTKEGSSKTVSVLADLGVSLLGSTEGDVIEWTGPSGRRQSRIIEIIYQPERLGNYEL
jgi:regulator of nucleoside diphosphate kinase